MDATPIDRSALLERIEDRWHQLQAVIANLSDEDWRLQVFSEEGGPERWTVADAIAHLAAWQRNSTRVAERQAQPGSDPENRYPTEVLGFDTAEFNHGVFREWRDRPPAEVVEELRAAHQALVAALEPLPDDRLLVDGRARRWLRPALKHVNEHLEADILPALNSAAKVNRGAGSS